MQAGITDAQIELDALPPPATPEPSVEPQTPDVEDTETA